MPHDLEEKTGAVDAPGPGQGDLRTRHDLLEAQAESTLDGMLLVSPQGRMLSHNRRFGELWGFDEDLIASGDDDAALEAALSRVADPAGFIDRVRHLYAEENRYEVGHDEVALRDGRILDRYGTPVTDDSGAYRGRLWVFRDVTDQRRAEQRMALLARIGPLLDASLDPGTTLETIARVLVPDLGDLSSVVLVSDHGGLERVVVVGDPHVAQQVRELDEHHPPRADGPGPVAQVLGTGEPLLLAACDAAPLAAPGDTQHLEAILALHPRSAVLAPMRARGRTFGVLIVTLLGDRRPYDDADLRLVADIASRGSLAYGNARLYEERERVASTLQSSLLPDRMPTIPGIELASRYRAAKVDGDVGGDFYDAFAAGDDWALVVGDVCGKGAAAAALTGLARHTIRAMATTSVHPRLVFGALNAAILRRDAELQFCTVALARLRPAPGGMTVTLACAGHPPPLIVRAGGAMERPRCTGRVLGILDYVTVDEVDVQLGPGDAMLLFTDGLTEARVGDGLLDDAGLEGIVAEVLHAASPTNVAPGAAAIAEGVERRLSELGAELRDDMALLVVSVTA